ncbi:6,7,8-trihydroxycoumarin synthase-like [Salvia miltiorrhiza]|uniref:6,7,8-trihydroxycoumarin synthase-like n=1 Tax=Salvia miltiorrhiza TaxID=226208 RepID=UPI0025AC06D5|nr:6,7,8-trihydroxycoumarin synthase-like [Salvia miltiorrhiza]
MILLLSIFFPIIFFYLFQKTRKTTKLNLPPGPPRLPLIGNLHQIATAGDLHFYLWRLSKKYNSPIIHMKLGSLPLIVVSSPKLAKEVLQTQDLAFCSRPKSVAMQKLAYQYSDIAFSPYSDNWREMRKITSIHLFSTKKVQSFRPIREDEISLMIAKISKSASSHQVVNLSEMATALSSSLISRIAFGRKYNNNESEMRRFKKLLDEFVEMTHTFFVSDYIPALGWVDKLVGSRKRLDRIFENHDSFYQELIDEHLDPKRAKKEEEEDILDTLIKLKEDKSSSIDLNWNNIKALLMNIFVAGAETSSTAIIWVMTALIKAPNVMKKLQAEIRSTIDKKCKVYEDDLPNLPYLKAVIMESFRLYPSAPLLLPRETSKKSILDGYEIHPKTIVYVNAWAISRDPEYWENPDEFMPERFLNSNTDLKGKDFGLTPFGSGRRICPGMVMGLANVELIVANLLYCFDWELPLGIRPEDVDTAPLPGLAVAKKNALLLVPHKYGTI